MLVERNGAFDLNGLSPGKYRLDQSGGEPDLSLLRVEVNGALKQDAFEVKSGEQISGIRLVFTSASGALRGRIGLLGPLPAEEALTVMLRPVNAGAQLAQALSLDEKLEFIAQPLAVGEYDLIVTLAKQARELARRRVTIREGAPTEVSIEVRP